MDTQQKCGDEDLTLAAYTLEEQTRALDRLLADLDLDPETEEEEIERWDFMS